MTYKCFILLMIAIGMCLVLSACAGAIQSKRYSPPSGHGPLVLMISGKSGPTLYGEWAERLADSGYSVLLYDGNDFPINKVDTCQAMIRDIVKNNLPALNNSRQKVAVVASSLGGAVALNCVAGMQEEIAGIVAFYPATRFIDDHDACIDRLRVPLLVLQGEEDFFFDCCKAETARNLQRAARKKGKDFELVVYPYAGHGFNLGPMKNKELDKDAWNRTLEALKRYLP